MPQTIHCIPDHREEALEQTPGLRVEGIAQHTHHLAMRASELDEPIPEHNHAHFKKMEKFRTAYLGSEEWKKNNEMSTIYKFSNYLDLDPQTKYQTTSGLFLGLMKDFGKYSPSADNAKTPSWMRNNLIFELLGILEGWQEYFDDQAPATDFDYFLRLILGELVKPAYTMDPNNYDFALWEAFALDERLEKIEEIAKKYNTVDQSQIDKYKEQAAKPIAQIIQTKITEKYYTGKSSDNDKINDLKAKYNFELPSEFEFFKGRASQLMNELESIVANIEAGTEEESLKYHLKKNEREKIKDQLDILVKKYGEDVLPDTIKPLSDWLVQQDARIKAARQKNFDHLYTKKLEEMEGVINRILDKPSKDSARNLKSEVEKFKDFLRRGKGFFREIPELKGLLEKYLNDLDNKIRLTAAELTNDPSLASTLGLRVQLLGDLKGILKGYI